MLDPASDLLPPPSSPTISSVSSSDLDTESTGSFFHDRSTSLGTLMGVSLPAVTFRSPSQQQREARPTNAGSSSAGSKPKKRRALTTTAFGAERLGRRRRKWWRLCGDGDAKPASLGEFLEVERRFEEGAFYGVAAELEGVMEAPHDEHQEARNGRMLFADGRVLPPAPPLAGDGDDDDDDDNGTSTAGALCRFPVSLTGICSGGVE